MNNASSSGLRHREAPSRQQVAPIGDAGAGQPTFRSSPARHEEAAAKLDPDISLHRGGVPVHTVLPRPEPGGDTTRRLRVLVIAEACNPDWVSIPLEGWSLQAAMREFCDVHLVTQLRNREAIARAGYVESDQMSLAGEPRFTAIDSEKVAGPVYRAAVLLRGGKTMGWTTQMALSAVSYPYFEKLVWKRFGDRIAAGEWDLVHRMTPVSPTLPSLLATKCREAGVPFVMGPLNGGIPWPPGWWRQRLKEREFLSYVRELHRLMPGYRRTLRDSAAVIAGSRYTLSQVPAWARRRSYYVPENAIDPARFRVRRTRSATRPGPLRVCFVGRLVPYKGADVLIEAAAPLVRTGRVLVTIAGEGPMYGELEGLVRRLGVGRGIRMLGKVPHTRLQSVLAEQDVLGFPSVREFGGAVVVEAMAMGVVPVVVKYGGPGELVSAGCDEEAVPRAGILLPMTGRKKLVANLTDALRCLEGDRPRVDAMSAAAADVALTRFTWQAKAREIESIYRDVLERRKSAVAPA